MHTIPKAASLLLFVFLLAGCGKPKRLGPAAYMAWMNDAQHGYIKKVTAGNYEYSIQLASPEYMALQETADSPALLAARVQQLKGHLFLLVKMGTTEAYRKNTGGSAEDQRRLEGTEMPAYYDEAAAADMSLSGEQPLSYHFENNYGLTPYNTIVAAFARDTAAGDLQFVFNDRFRHIPHIQAAFSKSSIQELPSLQY